MSDISNPYLSKYILEFVDGPAVLDVGCGAGLYGFLLKYAYLRTKYNKRFTKIDGIDWDKETVSELKNHNIYDNVYLNNTKALPFGDNTYNSVICLENLEHLYEDELKDALKELYRVTNDVLIISTPPPSLVANINHCVNTINDLKLRDFIDYDEFKMIEASKPKSCISPLSMLEAGFKSYGGEGDIKICEGETCVYVGHKSEIDILKIKILYAHKNPLIEKIEDKNYKEEACMLLKNQITLDVYCNL